MENKLQAAKEYLGNRWVMHSNYKFEDNKHHSRSYTQSHVLQKFLVESGAIQKGRV